MDLQSSPSTSRRCSSEGPRFLTRRIAQRAEVLTLENSLAHDPLTATPLAFDAQRHDVAGTFVIEDSVHEEQLLVDGTQISRSSLLREIAAVVIQQAYRRHREKRR